MMSTTKPTVATTAAAVNYGNQILKYVLVVYFTVWMPLHLMQEYIEHHQTWNKEFDDETEMNRVCNQASDAVKSRMQEHCERSGSVIWWGFHLGIVIPKLFWHFVERDILLGVVIRQILSWYDAYGRMTLLFLFGVLVLAIASVFQQMISHLGNQLLILVGIRTPKTSTHLYDTQSDVPPSSNTTAFYGNPSTWQHPNPTGGEGSPSPPPLIPMTMQYFAVPTTTDHNNNNTNSYTAIAQQWLATPLPSNSSDETDNPKKDQ
jgi:hypothetical protein